MSNNEWLPTVGVCSPLTNHSTAISFPEPGLHNPSSSQMLTSVWHYFFQLCSAPKTQYGSHCQVWFHCFWRRWVELPGWGYVEGKYSPQLNYAASRSFLFFHLPWQNRWRHIYELGYKCRILLSHRVCNKQQFPAYLSLCPLFLIFVHKPWI